MKKIAKIIAALIGLVIGIVVAIIAPFYTWLSVAVLIILPLCFIAFFCFKTTPKQNEKTENISQLFFLTIVIFSFLEVLFYVFYLTGILEHFRDIESARTWIQSFGALAWIIYFLIQFLQVVILPLPAQVTMIAGVLMFGAIQTFIISSTAVVLGSILCFWVGRVCGNKVLYLLFNKKTVNHYRNLLSQRGRILLPIFFILPIFPDDLLCFASGATSMSFKCFFIITLIFRPLAIAFLCWVGSGKFIPFSSWGIPVWIVLIILLCALMFTLFKFQKQIEDFVVNKFTREKK